MYSRSLFSGNATSSRFMFSVPTDNGGGGTGTTILDPLFNSPVYQTIMDYNTHFVNGDLTYLNTNLTLENFNTMASQLYALRSTDPIYEEVRLLINNILTNLYQAVIQYQLLTNVEMNLDSCHETAAILDSVQSILAYLENLKHTNYLFSSSVTTVAAKVKPEYALYISTYGIPEGGVFDPDKLATVIASL